MQLSVNHADLKKAVEIAEKFVESRPSIPVLSNILFNAVGTTLIISAMNQSELSRCDLAIPASVESEGKVTLPVGVFSAYVKNAKADTTSLRLDLQTQTVYYRNGKTKAEIKGIDAFEFPNYHDIDYANTVEIKSAVLADSIKSVFASAATNDSRPALTGIYFNVKGGSLMTAGADGYRLSVNCVDVEADWEATALIFAPVAKRIVEAIPAGSVVKVGISDGTAIFSADNYEFSATLLEAKFPPFERIIPTGDDLNIVELRAGDLRDALTIAAIYSVDNANRVILNLAEDGGKITSKSAERGESETELAVQAASGEILDSSYNVKYLVDALAGIKGDEIVRLFVKNPSKTNPLMVKPYEKEYPLHVIMPLG